MKNCPIPGKYRHLLVPGVLLASFLLALGLRGIPALFTPAGGFIPIYDSDTWYTLRQVEVMVHSFPQYNWFDPMTAYPAGKVVDWGPLHPALAAILALLAGATTRVPLVTTAMWLGPVLAACLVPVVYLLGKVLSGGKVGILAAILISFVSFRLFFLSSYGFVDHHVSEVLTTTLFLLAYATALSLLAEHPADLTRPRSLLAPVALSILAGILYVTALLASATVVILLLVAGIYTIIQIFADSLGGRPVPDLALVNTCLAAAAIPLLTAFGIRAGGFSLGTYSAGQILVCAVFALGTLAFAALSWFTRGNRRLFLGSCAVFLVLSVLALFVVPVLRSVGDQALQFFSLGAAYSVAIQEMHPWTLGTAWQNFNLFLVLGAGGLLLLLLRLRRSRGRGDLLLGVWSLSVLLITILHSRFEYYLAVPLVLLSALFVVDVAGRGLHELVNGAPGGSGGSTPQKEGKDQAPGEGRRTRRRAKKASGHPVKEKGEAAGRRWGYPAIAAAAVLALLIAGSGLSLWIDIQSGLQVPYRQIKGDWLEALSWMDTGTPPVGVDYFGRYDAGNFSYPAGSYGVMASWEAGHWITFFSRRIPNVNPFQDNLAGDSGGAAFLLAPSEGRAYRILDLLGARYIVTDVWTATDRFATQIPWVDPSVNTTPYFREFYLTDPADPTRAGALDLYDDAYFRSMIVRLHTFDGSMEVPGRARYIEYTMRMISGSDGTGARGTTVPSIARIEERDAGAAARDAAAVNTDPGGKVRAIVLSDRPDRPLSTVPAVSRLRLVHESPGNVTWEISGAPVRTNISHVKVFEYVKGARIRGTGVIELSLVTNTGRPFTYRQESVNGEFVVPYSTRGNPYDVKATGPYRLSGSTTTYEVTEEQVISGSTVNP